MDDKMNKYEEALHVWNEETGISAKESTEAYSKGTQYFAEWWGNKSFEAGYQAGLIAALDSVINSPCKKAECDELYKELLERRKEVRDLKASLGFYADKGNWHGTDHDEYRDTIAHTDMERTSEPALDQFGGKCGVQYGGQLARQVTKDK